MTTTSKSTIRIANASGYWGDDPTALKRQVEGGPLDYITMDFLAEITMSIMQKQRAQDPKLGYARDFVSMLEPILGDVLKKKIRIITNAGGVNPKSCAEAIAAMAKDRGLTPKIAVVYGDDILSQVGDLQKQGIAFDNMETGEKFTDVAPRLQAANVYFGARAVVEALKSSPDIIITGRVTDTGITLAPMLHEFGWSFTDWNRLAAGIIAGHIIECGSQSTGGNFTDWHKVKSFDNIGYPIVEMNADGTFVVTKHGGTGGLVSVDTVREQLVYEMGNPHGYITPDVVADFATIQLAADGDNRVRVSGIKGYEPTPFYKVSMAYSDGFKIIGSIAISGPDAAHKAQTFAEIFWKRVGKNFLATETEYFGYNACHRSLGFAKDGEEIVLRLGARSNDKGALMTFSKMVPSLILGGPPGVAVLGGAPKPAEVVSYWPALMPKEALLPRVAVLETSGWRESDAPRDIIGQYKPIEAQVTRAEAAQSKVAAAQCHDAKAQPLSKIALGRSGDKGDMANIGILARSPKAYQFLKSYVTAQRVKDLFQELCDGTVIRYELDNLSGLNFLLDASLGGGGTMTLRADAQGKTFAQGLLRQKALIPEDVLASVHSQGRE